MAKRTRYATPANPGVHITLMNFGRLLREGENPSPEEEPLLRHNQPWYAVIPELGVTIPVTDTDGKTFKGFISIPRVISEVDRLVTELKADTQLLQKYQKMKLDAWEWSKNRKGHVCNNYVIGQRNT